MSDTIKGDLYEVYELYVHDTYAEITLFDEKYKKYDIIEDARRECARLNEEFKSKVDILHRAFSAYQNAPHGWIFEARMERALKVLAGNGWSLERIVE